jgi:hypothetical protein
MRRYIERRNLYPASHESFVIRRNTLKIAVSLSLGVVLSLALGSTASAFDKSTFFDAALCKPAYSAASATKMYNEAEKLAKADMSLMTAAVYKLSADFGRQGFKTKEVVFAGTSFGILVDGLRADDLAKTYHLTSDGFGNLLGTATKSYGRTLAKAEQPAADMGVVSVVARESSAFPGKTLLACEFVSHEDLEAMKSLQSLPK